MQLFKTALHWYEKTHLGKQNLIKPHQKLLEHKKCLTICIVTKPHLGKVCIFLPILFHLLQSPEVSFAGGFRMKSQDNLRYDI